jgi:hypothetical protein
MDRFSIVILERTVELATEAMPPDQDPRVAECVSVIRQYIESPNSDYDKKLHYAVTALLGIARENCQFLIAARLSPIASQLGETFGKSDVA